MKKILIINHATEKMGSANYFENYLMRAGYQVLRLTHPLDNYKGKATCFFYNQKEEKKFRRINVGIFNLFTDFFLSVAVLMGKKFDVFIGANNFDTLTGIFLRGLGKKIDKIIFFGSDFSENRFKNKLLNKVYLLVEKIVIKKADFVISNTMRAEQKRLAIGLAQNKSFVVPNGIYISNPSFEAKEICKNKFIFVGNLSRNHGLYNFLKVFHNNIQELTVIGVGEEYEGVEKFCQQNHVSIKMLGAHKHEFILEYLMNFTGFGLAPYTISGDNKHWTYYGSPSKISEYIACGVPVIVSSEVEIADYVQKNGLGLVYRSLAESEMNNLNNLLQKFNSNGYNEKSKIFYTQFQRDVLYQKIAFMFK